MVRSRTAAPREALAGIASAGAVLLLAAACSSARGLEVGSSAGSPPTSPATAAPSAPGPSSTAPPTAAPSATTSNGPLAVSTPVAPESAPESALGGSTAANTAAPSARSGQPGVTQRHPFAPSSITLRAQGADPASAPVYTTDTTASGELGLPADPGDVGWWQSGALAGDAYGSVVLAGHLDSRDHGVGFFARLLRVKAGDEVVLEDATWQQRYRVTATRDVPKADLATGTDTFSQSVPGRLVLLTCTGQWSPVTHYPDNLVVTAEPLGVPAPRVS